MRKVGKVLFIIVLIPYIVMVVFLTACLLNYNQYNVTTFGNKSLIIINNEGVGEFEKGDLLVVTKNQNKEVNVGDDIFFYNTADKDNIVSYGTVTESTVITEKESTYQIEGDLLLSSEYMIGKASTSDVYPSLGGILGFLESRWGFLFFVIFPVLILFIYEIYMFIMELKYGNSDEEE